MQKLMHIYLIFLYRTSRNNKSGELHIVSRIVYREERRDLYTGIYCNKADLNTTKGEVKSKNKKSPTINQNLDLISYKALQAFDEIRFSGVPFTPDDMLNKVKGKDKKPALLIEFLQSRNSKLAKRPKIDVTQTTYGNMKVEIT